MIELAMTAAALADKKIVLDSRDYRTADDIEAYVDCLEQLGVGIAVKDGVYEITPFSMSEDGSGGFLPIVNCKNNSAALRVLVPVMAALKKNAFVSGTGDLAKTPFDDIRETMEPNGSEFRFDHFPFELDGDLKAGRFVVKDHPVMGRVSDEFVAGLLMACPFLEGDSIIEIDGSLTEAEWIKEALKIMESFGVRAEKNQSGFRICGGQSYVSPE